MELGKDKLIFTLTSLLHAAQTVANVGCEYKDSWVLEKATLEFSLRSQLLHLGVKCSWNLVHRAKGVSQLPQGKAKPRWLLVLYGVLWDLEISFIFLQRSIGLPDVHSGYGFAIGNMAAFDMNDPEAVVSPGKDSSRQI